MLALQARAKAKFDETVEIALRLGTDPRKGEQQVRGAVVLPHGTGKPIRVCVFTEGEGLALATQAGALFLSLNTAFPQKTLLATVLLVLLFTSHVITFLLIRSLALHFKKHAFSHLSICYYN